MIRSKYLLAAVLAAATFTANAIPPTYDTTFDSISSLTEEFSSTTITGALTNGTPATLLVPARTTSWTGDRCDRKFDLMLTEPGVYTLTVTMYDETVNPPGGPVVVTRFVSCTLTRKP